LNNQLLEAKYGSLFVCLFVCFASFLCLESWEWCHYLCWDSVHILSFWN
jgi:hypothetical protein